MIEFTLSNTIFYQRPTKEEISKIKQHIDKTPQQQLDEPEEWVIWFNIAEFKFLILILIFEFFPYVWIDLFLNYPKYHFLMSA